MPAFLAAGVNVAHRMLKRAWQQYARVMDLVRERSWTKLWEGDELLRELKAGRLLTGFLVRNLCFQNE